MITNYCPEKDPDDNSTIHHILSFRASPTMHKKKVMKGKYLRTYDDVTEH